MPYSQTCLMTNDKLKRYVEISSRIRQYLEWEDHKAHESFPPKDRITILNISSEAFKLICHISTVMGQANCYGSKGIQ